MKKLCKEMRGSKFGEKKRKSLDDMHTHREMRVAFPQWKGE